MLNSSLRADFATLLKSTNVCLIDILRLCWRNPHSQSCKEISLCAMCTLAALEKMKKMPQSNFDGVTPKICRNERHTTEGNGPTATHLA